MENKEFDVIIIGGGPAGITAGIYCTRAGLKTLIIEEMAVGGQSSFTSEIDNYPGFPAINGFDLAQKFQEHAEKLGVQFVFDSLSSFNIQSATKSFVTTFSGTFESSSVILCMGAKPRKLGLENEEQFVGRGVSYCATCDGAFYKDKTVLVVGGGNSAVEEALFLSKTAKKVVLMHILSDFQANDSMVDKMKNTPNIEFYTQHEVIAISGVDKLQKVSVRDELTKQVKTLDIDGLFIAIGRVPSTDIVKGVVDLDKGGYVIANDDLETNIEGVFVAGDLRQKKVRQIITACADGAIASNSVKTFLLNM